MPDDGKYILGPFLVDCQRRKICRADVELNVHWRSFLALRELLEARGEVVDKNRLVDLLWGGATVEESNLHKYISHLRRALNEADPTQEYITTVPRLGYRLAIPAEKLPDLPEPTPPTPPRRVRPGPRLIAAIASRRPSPPLSARLPGMSRRRGTSLPDASKLTAWEWTFCVDGTFLP